MMERMRIWVVEAQHVSRPGSRWTPVLGKNNLGWGGAHRTRFMARKAAKEMQKNNMHNEHTLTVRYRVRKYETARGD